MISYVQTYIQQMWTRNGKKRRILLSTLFILLIYPIAGHYQFYTQIVALICI